MSRCPSPLTLARLGHDSLDESSFGAIEAHVEACADCQASIERLAREEPDSDPPPGPGRPPTIPGFSIERELGRGGMGVVYQAFEPHLGRRVAIKFVNGGIGVGPVERRRWLREARTIAQVRHRNVVPLHGAGEQGGWLYLILDLIPGGSLKDRVSGPVAPRSAAALVETVARAVEQVHAAGILHLDIKPSNILMDGPPDAPWEEASPMISDFGIAWNDDDPGASATATLAARGTPSFMAPEQAAGDRGAIGPHTDVFAIGATLYMLLTGRPPFQAPSVIGTLDLVRACDPTPPIRLIPDIPPDLQTIALTCLRKDPRKRYASATDLADDLRRWLDGFPIHARAASAVEHAARWCRRRPAIATLLGTLGLTIATALVGLGTLWRRAEDARALAVENEVVTSRAVGDLVRLMSSTIDTPHLLTNDRFAAIVRTVRDLTAKLRKGRTITTSNLIDVSRLELRLSMWFERMGKFREGRELLGDALGLLEARREVGPHDPEVVAARNNVLLALGIIARRDGRLDEALGWFGRAAGDFETLGREIHRPEVIASIYVAYSDISEIHLTSGDAAAGRRAREANLLTFESLARGSINPSVHVLAALARLDLDTVADAGSTARLGAAIARYGPGAGLPTPIEHAVSSRICVDLASFLKTTPAEVTPGRWAEALTAAIEGRCRSIGVSDGTLRIVWRNVGNLTAGTAAAQRRAGRLDDARRTTACLRAFAESLRRRAPEDIVTHLVASGALEQAAKDAWRVADFPAIERALIEALAEASIALRIAPDDEEARLRVSGLQEKLVDIVSTRSHRSGPDPK